MLISFAEPILSPVGRRFEVQFFTSAGWIGLALSFGLLICVTKGGEAGILFLTGYLVEESLSVDNLVVIALIFQSFRIKAQNQGPVLKWGILGAIIFRLVFVLAGVWLLEHMHSMIYIFGGLLLWSRLENVQRGGGRTRHGS